ncbi:MAG: cob(I)yrinic acid a,c-diamide adenosyltransferase [Bacteroidales bacterium]
MKIYTKAGDNGTTSLCDGSRLSKDDMRVEAYGALDELNAHIGLLISLLQTSSLKEGVQSTSNLTDFLSEIQEELFVIGGELACAEINLEDLISTQNLIRKVETNIDELSSQLPVQHHFVMPGGIIPAAQSHVCRTICRRAERRIVTLSHVTTLSPEILVFVNRLSDYLFILSRYLNKDSGTSEKTWKNTCR